MQHTLAQTRGQRAMPETVYGGRHLRTELPLPVPDRGTPPADAGRGLSVRVAGAPYPEPDPAAWVHDWEEEDGSVSLSLARMPDGFLLRVPGEADFLVSDDAHEVTVRSHGDHPDPATLAHLLLDQILPRMLAHQGHLVLHAAAVARGGAAVLLAGGSGAGKSTLAAALLRRGWTVLSDDAVAVEWQGARPVAVPTYPGLRLNPDALHLLPDRARSTGPMAHYSDKVRVTIPGETSPAAALSAIFLLDTGEADDGGAEPSARRVPPAEACMALIRNSFQLDLADRTRQERHLGLASTLADQIPVFALRYPRDFADMDRVCAALTHAVEGV